MQNLGFTVVDCWDCWCGTRPAEEEVNEILCLCIALLDCISILMIGITLPGVWIVK